MEKVYISEETFDRKDFTEVGFAVGEYNNCQFRGCYFAQIDLSDCKFIGCTFVDCNLSLIRMYRSAFRDVLFKECKMLGMRFDTCLDFGLTVAFANCQLNHSSFY
jgi:uncharacterized protein YjbI with pentapeptide repeats